MHTAAADPANTLTIAGIIASRAADVPAAVAIRAPGRDPLTYGGLHAAVKRAWETLGGMGLGPGDRVAVVLPNGPEMAVAFLAVASAATCAPLNPAYKENDFAFSFGDLGVKAVVVEGDPIPAAVAAARRLSLPLIELIPQLDGPAGSFVLRGGTVGAPPAAAPCVEDIALVLHTSGTTARPKIVPLTQRNLCISAANIRRGLELGARDSCLNVMPLFHIHGLVGALLSSMEAGASVTCTAGFRAPEFAAWLRGFDPTWYTAVPTIHQAVLDACAGDETSEGSRLRFIRSSSASLPPRLMQELAARFEVPVIEAYGMTEASHQMASNPLRGVQKPGSVGLPAGPEIAVMDEAGRLQAPGTVGELVIRGETVTKGYEGNPQANATAFVDGWFRTGDQGYIDDSGYAFLTGRLKELINRGGEKIAPREVEEALMRHAAVAQAVAFAIPHERLGEEVGAAVVLKVGMHATSRALRRVADDQLAPFKVPRLIEIVDAIPKGPTGKVQRTGLAARLGLIGRPTEESAPPSTPLEQSLAAEWMRLLAVERIGIDDDFFALGGDSLLATELFEAISALLQMDVPIADFLEQPTIAGLIGVRERALEAGVAGFDDVVPIRMEGSGFPLFCTTSHDGSLWPVSRLVRHLARDRPIYGFPLPSIDARGALPTIEDLAVRGLAALQRMQPEGPVHLIGPCFGGVVALEMACRLERMGRPVALLVMINSFNRAWRRIHPEQSGARVRGRHLVDRVRFHWDNLRRRRREERVEYARARAGLALEHWRDEALRLLFELTTNSGLPRPRLLQRITYANRRAQARYEPRPYAGPVLMVRSAAPIADVYPLPRMGWSHVLAGEVEMLEVPCEQIEFWYDEQVVRRVAERISARLEPATPARAAS